jgi:hypothetical protein
MEGSSNIPASNVPDFQPSNPLQNLNLIASEAFVSPPVGSNRQNLLPAAVIPPVVDSSLPIIIIPADLKNPISAQVIPVSHTPGPSKNSSAHIHVP